MLKRFSNDERGVMMMVGVIAAAFLIGACWYVWGIGRATVFRESLQSAADSSAYLMSVYDARGMNIIAMINLVMSVVLTVLVICKVIQAIVFAVNIISCIFGAMFNPVCDATTAAEVPLSRFVDGVAKVVEGVLTGLSLTESAIAIAWPLLPAGQSVTVAGDYQPQALATMGIGMSNIPPVADIANNIDSLKDIGKNFKNGSAGFCSYEGEFFLPVANDDYKNLCGRAGQNVVFAFELEIDLAAKAFHAPDKLVGAIDDFFKATVAPTVGKIVSDVPEFFCMDSASGLKAIGKRLFGLGHKSKKGDADEACNKKTGAEGTKCRDAIKKGKESDTGKGAGKDGGKGEGKGGAKGSGKSGGKGGKGGGFGETCSKTLSGDATMLGDRFANWGFALGKYDDVFSRPVGAATVLKDKTKVKAAGKVNFQFAQSEFYYEPKAADETQEQEEDPLGLENTMWNMRWRARLRRVRTPSVTMGSATTDLIGKIAGAGVDKIPGLDDAVRDVTKSFLEGAASGLEGQSVQLGPGVSREVIH